MRQLLPVFVALFTTVSCHTVDEDEPRFVGDVEYSDTLAVVGHADESNPLLAWGMAIPMFMDSTTIGLIDPTGQGRVAVVDILSGAGWSAEGRGAEHDGPGEWGAMAPNTISVHAGTVHTINLAGRYNAWSAEGELVSSTNLPREMSVFGDRGEQRTFHGILDEGIVVQFHQATGNRMETSPQVVERGLRLIDPTTSSVRARVTLEPVEFVYSVGESEDGSKYVSGRLADGSFPITVAARGDLIAYAEVRSRWLRVLDDRGVERAFVEDIGYRIGDVLIDADGRIWAQVWAEAVGPGPKWITFDSSLREVARSRPINLIDANGDRILTLHVDELGVGTLHLIRSTAELTGRR